MFVENFIALPEGVPRHKVGNSPIMAQLLERWNAMGEAERVAATEDSLRELVSDREARDVSAKQTPLAVQSDIRRTLGAIEKEVRLCDMDSPGSLHNLPLSLSLPTHAHIVVHFCFLVAFQPAPTNRNRGRHVFRPGHREECLQTPYVLHFRSRRRFLGSYLQHFDSRHCCFDGSILSIFY